MNRQPWYILGAGALGTLFAAQLRAAGRPCQLLGRSGSAPAIRRIDYRVPLRLDVSPADALPLGCIRYLLITTKAYAVAEALCDLRSAISPGAVIVVCANGMGFEETAQRQLDGQRLLRAVSTEAAHRSADKVVYAGEGQTRLGDPRTDAPAEWFATMLHGVAHWQWEPTIDRAVQEKFAINCIINPLTAAHGCRNGTLVERGELRGELESLCVETEQALRRLGIWAGTRPLLEGVSAVCHSTAANRSSMLQDLSAGRRTEIEFLNGYLLRRAAESGFELPHNARLVHRVRGAERA